MKKILTIILGLAIVLAGANYIGSLNETETHKQTLDAAGVITLSVNPKINVRYDEEGKVLNLKAGNEDGAKIIAEMQDYVGKDAKAVICDLIKEIHNQGYFVDDIDGYTKDIVIQINEGSKAPTEDYFEELKEEVIETAAEIKIASNTTTIEDDDYITSEQLPEELGKAISQEKAEEIAIKRLDLNADAIKKVTSHLEYDDGIYQYEVEVLTEETEYDVEVEAFSGVVLEVDKDAIEEDDDDIVETSEHIGKEKALEIALNKAGETKESAKEIKSEFDDENQRAIYEVEFKNETSEFSYEIDALTGEILNEETELDDDAKDVDDDLDDDLDDDMDDDLD